MGYRSEVIIGINKSHSKTLQGMPIDEGESFTDHFTLHDTRGGMEIWTAEHIKWWVNMPILKDEPYAEYYTMSENCIDSIAAFIQKVGEDGFIVCIGEENERHSEIGDWWDYITIQTTWS